MNNHGFRQTEMIRTCIRRSDKIRRKLTDTASMELGESVQKSFHAPLLKQHQTKSQTKSRADKRESEVLVAYLFN